MRLFTKYKAFSKPCWCGADVGQRCQNRQGKKVPVHHTRGVLDRATIDALSESAHVNPDPPD